MNTTNHPSMGRDEILRLLHAERFALEQRWLALRKQAAAIQGELDAIGQRLVDIDHGEGLLR